jgi:tetratricopeptide (TPR) repeat protein
MIGNTVGHYRITARLGAGGKSELAILRKLVAQHPESLDFASILSGCLSNIGRINLGAKRVEEARVQFREAIERQRKALNSNPANPQYRQFMFHHLNGLLLTSRLLGDPGGMAEADRELAKLRDSDPATAALDARLAAILKGVQQPKGEAERLALAQRAYDKGFHATAARLFGEALRANPKLADSREAAHRYNAACAAALAGCRKGKDEPPPDDASRIKLRRQALDWLKAELAVWSKILESGPPQAKALIAQTLKHWKEDTDLAGIRDDAELAKFPEGERKDWQALWAAVDALRRRLSDS